GFAAITAVLTADRIGKGIRTAPRDSLITASSHPADLGRSFGVHRMLDNIGAAIGPLVAFFILLVIPNGFHTIFVASLAFALIGVAILGLLVPNTRNRKGAPTSSDDDSPVTGPRAPRKRFAWGVVLKGPMRRVLAGAGILGLLTIGDGFVYLVLQSRSDFAAQWFPLLYVGTNVVFLVFAIPLGRLSDRVGRARVFVFGHVALLGAYLVAAMPLPDIAATLTCLLFLGVFYASTDGVLAALAAQLTTPETHGTGLAAVQTVVALSRLIASTSFGILWFTIGREPSMYVVAGLLTIAIPLIAVLFRPFLASVRSRAS
ncbi:MAG TPA: MFS transporter, partial [Microbacterium sp.]|uniref:MFS transporter n=1 Tax=Microbacterium sp. TaxID=51671 RepID=UPI002B7A4625